jgi:fumarate reductase iron-sulfur subunit
MPETVTLRVTRYRPEIDAEPVFQEYQVPLHADWVVLDALNYVKDNVDGTLSYRWSCRMGICGSCGMTVNGEPKLTCATFLVDNVPGPIRVEPLGNFPVIRDLVIEMGDFMRKLTRVKPWIVRTDEKPLAQGEYRQTPEQMDEYKQFSMCINCMLCYAACPVYGLEPSSSGRRPSPWPSATTSIPAMAAPRNGARSCPRTTGSGAAPSSANAPGSVRSTSIPPAPSSATS